MPVLNADFLNFEQDITTVLLVLMESGIVVMIDAGIFREKMLMLLVF